jgi:hypothetical protein
MATLEKQPVRENLDDQLWNLMSVVLLLCMVFVLVTFIQIFQYPASSINPFPPPTQVERLVVPTATPTVSPTPVTPTPSPSATPAPTQTPQTPTLTPTVTDTPTETPTQGPTGTPTINSAYPFIKDNTSSISGEVFHANEGCKLWLAGQSIDLQRAPMVGITVMLGGTVNGRNLYQLSLTGTALQYGPAGYEFTVADSPFKSTQQVWVMLLDQAGIPLSNRVYFDTSEDCSKNLILVNFKQVR